MWDQIVKYFIDNMDTIKKSKGPFILILMVGLLLGAYLNGIRYDGIVNNKDNIIDTKNAIIEQLQGKNETTKTIIFDDRGTILFDTAAKTLNTQLSTEKIEKNIIRVRLRTDRRLKFIPKIESVTPFYFVNWVEIERMRENIIIWTGRFAMHGTDMMHGIDLIPHLKMEIYLENT